MGAWEDFSKYDQKWQQQVLAFDFWEEEKQKEAKRHQEQTDSLPHFPEPKNDNEYLLECQWEYRHGDQDALVQMYRIRERQLRRCHGQLQDPV